MLLPLGSEERQRLLETVRGERPADLFIRGGRIANVYSGELHEGNVAVAGSRIAYVGEGEQAVGPRTKVLDASGMILSPGYVEAHSHPRGCIQELIDVGLELRTDLSDEWRRVAEWKTSINDRMWSQLTGPRASVSVSPKGIDLLSRGKTEPESLHRYTGPRGDLIEHPASEPSYLDFRDESGDENRPPEPVA